MRRGMTYVGILLVIVGLTFLGWASWEYAGTNWTSHRHQRAAVHALTQQWESTTGSATVTTKWGKAEAIVRIPRFGSDYAVPVFEGTGDTALAAGLGHFDGTAAAGGPGNYVLAGHRVTHGEPLHNMASLRVGDRVVVETKTATYTYRMISVGNALTVSFKDTWVLDDQPVNPKPSGYTPALQADMLTLVTCSELFHTNNRWVAFATLDHVDQN